MSASDQTATTGPQAADRDWAMPFEWGSQPARGNDTRPVWLLDVDGALNANRPAWWCAPHNRSAYAEGKDHRVRWAGPLVSKVRRLVRSGTVDVRWAATWCPWANQLEHLFTLPDLPRQFAPHEVTIERAPISKLNAALAIARSGRPLVWTGDDAIPYVGPDSDELHSRGALSA